MTFPAGPMTGASMTGAFVAGAFVAGGEEGGRSGLGQAWRARRRRERFYGVCPLCGHDWREHDPGAGCGECRYEIEHEEPGAPADRCRAVAPGYTFGLRG
ncbi:hypothetical protein [Paractinoplanes atraurantiacus]|uniref:Uncharacterized protein n=1 Tax=Paractinoplanes atraurantiacus TaxID=1036182 RepID=A0A285J7X4_9ACTN|nr:hypothetical protein [Actinoplanes atraurantiacus]SNY56374.1 hypothetical protein SAMN05421748_117143 [Actinoplanes atraurantiacus]